MVNHPSMHSNEMASIKYESFSEEETDRIKLVYDKVYEKGHSFIRTIPGYVTLPLAFEKFQRRIKNWIVRQDDVYVLTFPKNGTTWTQELTWLLQKDCNFEEAKTAILDNRMPFLDTPTITDFFKEELPQFLQIDHLKKVEEMQSPRMITTHFRLCLLPDNLVEKSKVVICLRNPKDTVVSYYHHEKRIINHSSGSDFPTFFGNFIDNLVRYSPYFEHVAELWQRRYHPSVCLLFFEDMKRDLASTIRKVARFLGKNLTDELVQKLVNHLSFTNMKNNTSVNKEHTMSKWVYKKDEGHFMRKGEIGDWKNYFTDEMNKRMDEAIEKHFKPIGLEFQYE